MGAEAATARARGQQAPRSPEDLPAGREDHAGGSWAGEGLGGHLAKARRAAHAPFGPEGPAPGRQGW